MARRKQVKQQEQEPKPFFPQGDLPVGEQLVARRQLQEIMLTVTNEFIGEHREEILRRTEARLKTIQMLSK